MAIARWMSWEGGVDLSGGTAAGLAARNAMLHVGRLVHTPIGSAPSGLVLWQPDPRDPPVVCGFVSTDARLARWFGPNLFAGTPFERAPALAARIRVRIDGAGASARVEAGGHVFESELTELGALERVEREPTATSPFLKLGIEAIARKATLKVDGKDVGLLLPPAGASGSAPAVLSPTGFYAR